MSDPIQLVVFGAAGRMGQAIFELASQSPDLEVSAGVVRPGSGVLSSSAENLLPGAYVPHVPADAKADALVDFSGPGGFDAALDLARARGWPLVSGSTGLSQRQLSSMEDAATHIPVLWAANFSLGVAALAHLVSQAARLLPDWDCEIIEAHHRNKRDAPSGTALMLGRRIRAARGGTGADSAIDRSGSRRDGEIGYAAIRAGDIVGEHEVRLAAPGERIELIHRATDRNLFARGALTAARWLAGKPPGFHGIADVLGLDH